MVLPLLNDAIAQMENARPNSAGDGWTLKCVFCGGSRTDTNSLSIRSMPDEGEPILYTCFRASCGRHGALKSKDLEEMGITDPAVFNEVVEWNRRVKPGFDKGFKSRSKREFVLVNIPTVDGRKKLKYVNQRLGVHLKMEHLKDLKIQLSLKDLIRINDIRKLGVPEWKFEKLEENCIGFVSMFNDYMICRDISPNMATGYRYYNYPIAGKSNKDDLKVYCIPGEVDIMEPSACEINVAEGPFSILGAYLNTDLGREKRNHIWLANCGAQYTNTIMRVCKQFGFLRVRLNIWSDSEIPMTAYKKLYRELKDRLNIRSMVVYYNGKAEDFGHSAQDIEVTKSTII